MHRLFQWLVIVIALYFSVGCSATRPPGETIQAQPPVPAAAPASAVPATETPAHSAEVLPQLSANAVPHIAVILPLNSTNTYLEKAAKAVEDGFVAAYKIHPGALPIRVYACTDESKEAVVAYRQALSDGAKIVVGPLTRDGVLALSNLSSIPVPTLALNITDDAKPLDNLYFFGLTLEGEARQVARLAAANGMHVASIVMVDTPLSTRIAQAFSDEWKKTGGVVAATKTFTGDTTIFSDLPIDIGDMVFIAAPATQARLFRPYLNAVLPVYATSQIFNGNMDQMVNFDLRDVQFVDMPWLLQPDHPEVSVYPRPVPPLEIDLERLYALGIDSYRLMQIIYDKRLDTLPLNGVTGIIHLGDKHQFEREAISAEFKQGLGLTPEAFATLNADKKQ